MRQIELMSAEFTRMIADLDREIVNEEKRAGISDPHHFAYPTYARAAGQRRDNLKRSIVELTAQHADAKTRLKTRSPSCRSANPSKGARKTPSAPPNRREALALSAFCRADCSRGRRPSQRDLPR